MKAMILTKHAILEDTARPLESVDWPIPEPGDGEVLIRVRACGVCHTEIDEIEGRVRPATLPVILGHQVVGLVERLGAGDSAGLTPGQRVGVAWIYTACGSCRHCRAGLENLCSAFRATGKDAHGGYAEYMKAPAAFTYPLPDPIEDFQAAPMLCAGAIGYRSLMLTRLRDGERLGLMGFGASAHLVLMLVRHLYPNSPVYVFARDPAERSFARELGAAWAGDVIERAPQLLASIIDTTPAWLPLVHSLENLDAGGRLVVNAIRKESSDQQYLTQLNYADHLWMEKELKSVANVTRADVTAFLALAAPIAIRPEIELFALEDANRALLELKTRRVRGAKVLEMG